MHNKELENQTDDELVERREELIATIEEGNGQRYTEVIEELLEVERELTLREDK